MKSPFMPKLIGHRGLPTLAPENTRASVEAALIHGISWVELDVTMAGDGTLVIMHDPDLRLYGQPNSKLVSLNKAELKHVDAGGWYSKKFSGEPLLFLDELLTLIQNNPLSLNLEIKINPDIDTDKQVNSVIRSLMSCPVEPHKLLVSSFNHEALALCRAHNSTLALGVLYEELPSCLPDSILNLNPTSIHCHHASLQQHQVQQIVRPLPLYCYTVNDADTFQKLLTWGVAGVFSDRAHAEDLRAVADQT